MTTTTKFERLAKVAESVMLHFTRVPRGYRIEDRTRPSAGAIIYPNLTSAARNLLLCGGGPARAFSNEDRDIVASVTGLPVARIVPDVGGGGDYLKLIDADGVALMTAFGSVTSARFWGDRHGYVVLDPEEADRG